MAIRFVSKATVKNKLVRSSNVWDGTAVYNPFTLVGNYDALATITVAAGGLSSITFAGIPQTGYNHLQIRLLARTNRAASGDYISGKFNSDSGANYSYHGLVGTGAAASAYAGTSASFLDIERIAGNSASANVFGIVIVDILDYTNTNKYKTIKSLGGFDSNGSGEIQLDSGSWRNTNAVTSINLVPGIGTSFLEYSQFALYGVK
jgi:hypothetical protein